MKLLLNINAWILASVLLAACASEPQYILPQGSSDPLIVKGDMGGPIRERMLEIRSLMDTGQPVVITGLCASACTLYLHLDQTCVAPTARMGFHGPSRMNSDKRLSGEEMERVVSIIASHYPPKLANWYKEEGHKRLGHSMYWRSGLEVVEMGATPCQIVGI